MRRRVPNLASLDALIERSRQATADLEEAVAALTTLAREVIECDDEHGPPKPNMTPWWHSLDARSGF